MSIQVRVDDDKYEKLKEAKSLYMKKYGKYVSFSDLLEVKKV